MKNIVFKEATDEERDFASDNFAMMSSEEEVLLDMEFVLDCGIMIAEEHKQLFDIIMQASNEGADYLMLTP